MKIPEKTKDFIEELEKIYKDKYETDENIVGTPEYWKKAGVIELIRQVKFIMTKAKNTDI
jgi:hypothetical protein